MMPYQMNQAPHPAKGVHAPHVVAERPGSETRDQNAMKNTEDANAGSLHPVVRHPAFDADGYPNAETLQHIVDWPYTDFKGLLDYVRPAVEGYGRMWEEKGAIKLATGGWSGNESIVGAMQENHVFWAMCWESSHRGGLTVFRMPNAKLCRPADSEAGAQEKESNV